MLETCLHERIIFVYQRLLCVGIDFEFIETQLEPTCFASGTGTVGGDGLVLFFFVRMITVHHNQTLSCKNKSPQSEYATDTVHLSTIEHHQSPVT